MRHPRCGLLQADWQGRRWSQRVLRVVLGREGLAVAVVAGYVAYGRCRSSSWVVRPAEWCGHYGVLGRHQVAVAKVALRRL